MGQTSATGGVQLFVGKLLSTVVLAVSTILIGLYILQSDYGLYTIALIPAMTFLLFQDWGVGAGLARFCAKNRYENSGVSIRKTILVGLLFELGTGIILSVSLLLFAPFIASTIFGKPEATFLIEVASITVLSLSLTGAVQNVFTGFERMDLSSYTMIFQAIIQGVTAASLVYLGYGALGAIIGYISGSIATSIISLLLFYSSIFKKLDNVKSETIGIRETIKPLLFFGVPLAISSILSGIQSQFYSLLMAAFCTTVVIGNFSIASNFTILVSMFTVPLTTVLFPTFSKINPKNEENLLKTVFSSSVKFASIIVVPVIMAVLVLSKPLIGTIYGDKWVYSSTFLSLSLVGNLFILLGTLSVPSILSALGETKLLMKMNLLSLSAGIPLGFLLIPRLGIIGLIVSSIIAAMPYLFTGLYFLQKRYHASIDLKSSGRIFLVCIIAAALVYFSSSLLEVAYWIQLAVGLVIFLSVFFVSAPLLGAIRQSDIAILRSMFSSFGIVSKLLEVPLKIMEVNLKMFDSKNTGSA